MRSSNVGKRLWPTTSSISRWQRRIISGCRRSCCINSCICIGTPINDGKKKSAVIWINWESRNEAANLVGMWNSLGDHFVSSVNRLINFFSLYYNTYRKRTIPDHLWHFPFPRNICPKNFFGGFDQKTHIVHRRWSKNNQTNKNIRISRINAYHQIRVTNWIGHNYLHAGVIFHSRLSQRIIIGPIRE